MTQEEKAMKNLNIERIRKHNELRKQCKELAETLNNEIVWNDYFKACSIEEMQLFKEKYTKEVA